MLWIYCNEDSYWWKRCKETDTSAVLAYEYEASLVHNWYMTFCPAFHNLGFAIPLEKKVKP